MIPRVALTLHLQRDVCLRSGRAGTSTQGPRAGSAPVIGGGACWWILPSLVGALAFPEAVGPIFDEINEKYGTNAQPIVKR